jgi:glycerol-3-phosphate dehydrogenase
VHARCLVNAAGPWAGQFLQDAGIGPARPLRLVKGSHIVVPRLADGPEAFLLQQPDGRVVFALPYEGAFTLVGTTDVELASAPGGLGRAVLDGVAIDAAETTYLCDAANRCFARCIGPQDVVWSYAGVRPLLGEGGGGASSASRDYRLEHDTAGGAPLLSVFGGKVTTFRRLAQEAVDRIGATLGRQVPAWTANACLPGGDLYGKVPGTRAVLEYDAWVRTRRQQFSWLPGGLLERYARAYGTRLATLLAHCRTRADLGAEIVNGLYEVEADYLVRQEWARSADDILWRRTKLGLFVAPGATQRLDAWLAARRPAAAGVTVP